MEHVSIDGRRRNKYQTAAAARKPEPESSPNLRPASPPRLNPWASAKKPAAIPISDIFPPLPKPHGLRSPATTPTSGVSRTSSRPPNTSRSEDDTEPATTTLGSASPSSNASSSSRRIFEAAAPRAVEKLWRYPFGADLVILSGDTVFRVHRNLVIPQSGWFRDNLPPPNLDGTPVEVRVGLDYQSLGHCLRYIYLGRIELCEYDPKRAWKSQQIPCCVLAYNAAVFLRMARLASYIIRNVENASVELGNLIQGEYLHRSLDCSQWVQFSWHYQRALDIVLRQQPRKLMMPMRLAMASILDAVIFWVVRQSLYTTELGSSWHGIIQSSMRDIAEYKQLQRSAQRNSVLPSEAVLRGLFEETEPMDEKEAKMSASVQFKGASAVTETNNGRSCGLHTIRRKRRCSL
ncbi:Ff.00g096050.m01.CDS01 [Fusarium sp. VM40]|nr:Ff.00g096050.m01.CDS01 [Fusarium sp. VM40]